MAQQLSAYEQALAADLNPAHVHLFLFICQRLQEKDVDAGDMAEKSDIFAAGLMGMINENSTGYNRQEVAILFDHFIKWYETPYGGKIQTRKDICWHVDYSPDRDFAEILQKAGAAIKEQRGPDGPKMPRSWGVGIKCSYDATEGHTQFESSTIDHQGHLLKVEPWEKFFQSEDPADESIALSLQPTMPWMMEYKFFYRTVARRCNLTVADAPAILAADNYYFGKYLYETESNVSAELKYMVFRADSLTKDSYLAKDILRGERYAPCQELLLEFPEQRQFSHSPADIDSYCPLLGMIVGDIWYSEPNCKFILTAEQRRGFALGFVEAAAIAIAAEDRAFRSVIDLMNDIFTTDEKPAIVQLLVKQLQRAVQTEDIKDIKDIIEKLQQSKLMKSAPPHGWDLPIRDLEYFNTLQVGTDPSFLQPSVVLHAQICETMGWTIADSEMLIDKKLWGFVYHLLLTFRSTDLKMIDRVWLNAIDAQKKDIVLLIYEQAQPLFHEKTRRMDCSSYGDYRNPFANMLKNFPQLVLDSSRTDASLCPPEGATWEVHQRYSMFRDMVIAALTDNVDDRKMLKYLQRCKALLEKLFPGDTEIKAVFAQIVREKLSRYGRSEQELAILAANWP